MKETRADAVRATGYALLLHALPVALALLGLWWTDNSVFGSPTATMIEADVVDSDTLPASIRAAMLEPVQQREPQIPPTQPVPAPPISEDTAVEPLADAPERITAPGTIEQEPVEQDLESDDTREQEQEEKQPQEQDDVAKREQEIEQKHPLSEMQLKPEQEPADRAANEAALQTTNAQPRDATETSADEESIATSSPPRGNNGVDTDLFARYQAAVREAILRNWTRPGWMPVGQRCKLVINQIPGGEVTEVQVDPSCPYDELDRRSLEAAVLQAQSLPYSGFEAVFQRVLILDFEAPDQ